MPRGRPPKYIMTVPERKALSEKIQQETDFRDAVERDDLPPGVTGPIGDMGGIKTLKTGTIDKNIAHLKKVLAEGTPERISGEERRNAETKRRELAERLRDKLLTHKEMDLMPRDGYAYHRAVRKSTAQEVGNEQTRSEMQEYRRLSALLDPDNPETQSIEALRRDT